MKLKFFSKLNKIIERKTNFSEKTSFIKYFFIWKKKSLFRNYNEVNIFIKFRPPKLSRDFGFIKVSECCEDRNRLTSRIKSDPDETATRSRIPIAVERPDLRAGSLGAGATATVGG